MYSAQDYAKRFDRFLIAFQRISLLLVLPALISTFSCIAGLFNPEYNLNLSANFAIALTALPENGRIYALIASFVYAAVEIPCTLLAAKGKLWPLLLGGAFIAADFATGFFILSQIGMVQLIVGAIIRGLILIALCVGIFCYFQADKLLKSHPKVIMNSRDKS